MANTSNATGTENDPMPSEWVATQYSGDQAKYVMGLAQEGIGYYVLEQPERGSGWVKVAFRRPLDRPRPDHLVPIMQPHMIEKLEEWSGR